MTLIFGSATDYFYDIFLVEVQIMRFSEKLAKKRKENNLSQEQLADRLGVSRQAVSKWESNQSYPDMEKMIQMCNILNCTLDELLDDGTIGSNVVKESRKTFNDYFNDFLKYITNMYNMFVSMTFNDKLKFIFEMAFIILILFLGGMIIFNIIDVLFIKLLLNIPRVGEFFYHTICNMLNIILYIIGIILFIHLLKVRYLDYYVTIEDDSVKEKTIEKEVDTNKYVQGKKEKVIIRDPKHSSVSFFNILYKIIILFVKGLLIFFSIFGIISFISLVVFLTISLYHLGYGIIFLWISFIIIGCLIVNYNVLEMIYRFIFNQKQGFKRIFITTITGFVLGGVGMGLTFMSIVNFDKVDTLEYETKEEVIEMTDDTDIYFNGYYRNMDYVIDNNIDTVNVEVRYLKGTNYTLEKEDNYYYFTYDYDFNKMYKIFLNDFKNKKIRYIDDANLIMYRVTLSEDNYNKLEEKHRVREDNYDLDEQIESNVEDYMDQE